MERVVRVFPVISREAAVRLGEEIAERSEEDKKTFYGYFGPAVEHVYYQEIEGKPHVIVVAEGPELEAGYQRMESSDDAFTIWFQERVQELTDFDIRQAPKGPPSEHLWSWGSDARTVMNRLQEAIERYGNGDDEAAVELLAEDVEWVSKGPEELPWSGTYRGVDGVRRYLKAAREQVEVRGYRVRDTIQEGDAVAVLATVTIFNKRSETTRQYHKVDVLKFRGQQCVRFEEYYDTAASIEHLEHGA